MKSTITGYDEITILIHPILALNVVENENCMICRKRIRVSLSVLVFELITLILLIVFVIVFESLELMMGSTEA